METVRRRLIGRVGLGWEKNHPRVLGVSAGLLTLWAGPQALAAAAERQWEIGTLYSSVFDLFAVFTAFLFTFYTLIVTTDRGFIGRMKNTRSYSLLKTYATSALTTGGIGILASIPLMVTEPDKVQPWGIAHIYLSAWVALSVWGSASFVRAARLFMGFIRQYD